MSNAFRALRTRNYRLYFTGQAVSLTGTWMQIIAQGWLVVQLTNSGVALGIVNALQFGPMLLGGMWGGVVADRLPKRRVLLVTQSLFVVQGVTLATLVATGSARIWMVYALAFVYGCVQAFDMPARQAFVPEMVGQSDVMNAVSLNAALFNAGRIVGPAIAGVLIAKASIAICFYANAASFLALVVTLLLMREDELVTRAPAGLAGRGQIRAGLRYVRSEPGLFLPLLLMTVVATLGFNFQIVLPLLAKFTFDGNAQTYSNLSVVIAVGSICGAMYAATRHRPSTRLLVGSAVGFGAALVATAFAPTLAIAYLMFPFVGLLCLIFIPTSNSTLQLGSTPEMRSRVMSLFSLVLLGSTPLGGPLIGWISEVWSPRAGLAIGGAATLVAAIPIGIVMLRRREPRPEPAPFEPLPLRRGEANVAVEASEQPQHVS